MKTLLPLSIALALAIVPMAHAADNDASTDNWVVRFGAHVVNPKADNGHLAGMKTSITSNVIVAGVGTHLELWTPEFWQTRRAHLMQDNEITSLFRALSV